MKIRKRVEFDIEVDDISTGQCSVLCNYCSNQGITGWYCAKFENTLENQGDNDIECSSPFIIFRCLPCIKAETVSGAA